MPPLTYPDQITYYGFCKTDDPIARKSFHRNLVVLRHEVQLAADKT